MAIQKTTTKAARRRTGPKLMGAKKRVRTTLCFDPDVLKTGKAYVKPLNMSLSLWIEKLMKAEMKQKRKAQG